MGKNKQPNPLPFWQQELIRVFLRIRYSTEKEEIERAVYMADGFIHGLLAADGINLEEFRLLNTVTDNARDFAKKDINHAPL